MTYGAEYWGPALISAVGSMASARSINNANMQINAFGAQQAWDMYHGQNEYNAWARHETEAYNSAEAGVARAFSASEAEKNRIFQSNQSATAYQRATDDMRKAGLNPMLAYTQGGASTPSGSMASAGGGASSPGMGGAAGQVGSRIPMQRPDFSSVLNAASSVVALKQQEANVELTRAQAEETRTRVPLGMNQALLVETQRNDMIKKWDLVDAQIAQLKAGTFKDELQAEVHAAHQQLLRAQEASEKGKPALMQSQVAVNKAEAVLRQVQAALTRQGIPEARAGAEFWDKLNQSGSGATGSGWDALLKGGAQLKHLFFR